MRLRSIASTVLVAALALTMSACGSKSDDGSKGSSPEKVGSSPEVGASTPTSGSVSAAPTDGSAPAAPGAGAAGLTIWADETRAKPLTDIAKEFEAANPGVKVSLVQKDFGKIRDDFISQAPTGKGPDIIVGAQDWLGKLVQNGVVEPIELGALKDKFNPVSVEAFTVGGKVYGLPYSVENIALIRNTDLAPQAPKDFADAVATGKQLVSEGKAKFPLLIQQDPKAGDAYHLYPLQTSFGAPVFGKAADGSFDPKNLAMKGDPGHKFAAWLAEMGKEGVLKSTISADIAKEAFAKGQSPYMITGPWNVADFTKAGIKLSVEKIPSAGGSEAQPFVGVQGFMVSAKSANMPLAQAFVTEFLSTEKAQFALYEVGSRPPALLAAFEKAKSDPIIAGFGEVASGGTPMPNIPAMDAVWEDWGTTELSIIDQKGDPTQLWDKMTASIEKKIAG